VREAVLLLEGAAEVEISGGITLETISAYADTGADFVSVGALTHSVPVFDIGLDMS
jgi:nicotinate-nucleotide pyrophosphorylase (carboxylating)